MTDIKLLVTVEGGKVFALNLSPGLWVEDNSQAHWLIDCLINAAIREAQEEMDFARWLATANLQECA